MALIILLPAVACWIVIARWSMRRAAKATIIFAIVLVCFSAFAYYVGVKYTAHLSVLTALMATLTTAYMGEQVVMILFLFAGWIQGMNPAPARVESAQRYAGQWSFRRVLA